VLSYKKGSACHELHSQISYILPKKSAKDKAYGSFPAPVIKTEEQQKFSKTLFQAYQVIISAGQGHHGISVDVCVVRVYETEELERYEALSRSVADLIPRFCNGPKPEFIFL